MVAAGGALGSVLRWLVQSGANRLMPGSAFPWESVALMRDGQWLAAVEYVGGSVLAGPAAALTGSPVALRL